MVEKINFDLVSPDKVLFSQEVELATLPGGEGDYGVMYGHQPIITTLRPGLIEIEDGEKKVLTFYVDGGFAEVTNQKCSVLADDAVSLVDFKKEDIQERIKIAENNIQNLDNDSDIATNEIRLEVLRKLLSGI